MLRGAARFLGIASVGLVVIAGIAVTVSRPALLPAAKERATVDEQALRAFGAGGGSAASKETTRWEEVTRPPPPRTLHALAFDSARGETVLFGGRDDTWVSDTWEWNGARWALRTTSGPAPRASHALVFDSERHKTLLFGGNGAAGPLDDTWEWSGTAWTRILAAGPSRRYSAAIAFDVSRARAVLFGGRSAQGALAETWEWDGNTWTIACATAECMATMPPARSSAAAAYDLDRHRVVLFGGNAKDGTPLGDTWEWDGAHWLAACAGATCATSPSARDGHALAYDAERHVTVLFGGESASAGSLQDTWEWNGAAWTRGCAAPCSFVTPASQAGHAMTYDSTRRAIVLVTGDRRGQTWEWDGAAWSERTLTSAPPRDGHAMVFDVARGQAVLFGGGTCERAGCISLGDTWKWDSFGWLRACTDASCQLAVPTARLAHAVAYDRARQRTVLFGGTTDGQAAENDTWEWDGARWANVCAQSPCADAVPPARFAHAMAYDEINQVTVLFGGQATTSLGKAVRFDDTWLWDGSQWKEACAASSATCKVAPSGRSRHMMAYDRAHKKTVLFGGIDGAIEADTWEWDGASWEEAHPPASPSARAYGALTYDPQRKVVVLFGGAGGASTLSDTWEWDGILWRQEVDTIVPPARTADAMVYDEVHGHLVLFAGFGESVLLGDTWEHRRVGGPCSADLECEGRHCVDGVCCESACSVCERCDGASTGQCVPVLSAEDEGSCTDANACDASGRCRRKDGQTCAKAADCVSGFCVDGVCCATACNGPCLACRADLKNAQPDGICGNVADGKDPHDSCADDGVCSCGHDGFCNGSGACRLYAKGTSCADCSKTLPFGDACDGLGACVSISQVHCDRDHTLFFENGTKTDCSPYRCSSAGACLETCTSNDECAAPSTCHSNGSCGAAPEGPSRPEEPPVVACGIDRAGRAPRGGWALFVIALAILRRRRTITMGGGR